MSYRNVIKKISIMLAIFVSSALYAEDIEIFTNEVSPSKPNILFLLDQSGSMNDATGVSGETRIEALRSAFNQVISNSELTNLNVGLMGFSNRSGIIPAGSSGLSDWPYQHGVSFPISPIDDEASPILLSNLLPTADDDGSTIGYFSLDDDVLPNPAANQTVREFLPDILSTWSANGSTPIVDAFYEAALYFRGAPPKWGEATPNKLQAAHPSTYTGSITAELSQVTTGEINVCTAPDCGINCVPSTRNEDCPIGKTTCGLNTNCNTEIRDWKKTCYLGSEAECLASNTSYSSCDLVSYEDCNSTCTGGTDSENGSCLGSTTSSCTTKTYYNCILPTEITHCDHAKYSCEATESNADLTAGARYISPITNQCQANAIILLSDGQPYSSDEDPIDTRENVKALIGRTANCGAISGQVIPKTNGNSLADGRCGPELAKFLATEDQNITVDDDNTVRTYTVGFGVHENEGAKNYLSSLAQNGGGKYFPASDTLALVKAFKEIINDIDSTARSFTAPVYTVDASSLLAHSKDIYLPLFENTEFPAWSGNLKKFKLNSAGKIVDRNGVEAVNAQGVLKNSAVDYWSDPAIVTASADDNAITSGGAASRIDPTTRNVLTDDGASSLQSLSTSSATKALLGNASMSDAYQNTLIQFAKGYAADGVTARKHMGDILHSKPTVVSYSNEQVVFFGTNEGYLHAYNAADATVAGGGGTEKFAYMPSSLLKNLDGQLKNTELTGSLKRIYGVDGSMTVWIDDKNKNGKVDILDGDTAYLYFGLRRGGRHLYALNITDPSSPSLLWKISNTDTGFGQLAETWSKPMIAKLRYKPNGTGTPVTDNVLVFGGGYDTRMDEEDLGSRTSLSSTKGNAIYIVNAKTKALIWSYSGNKLKHSVPGNIRSLDLDRNGSIDRLYFGDTGGNIWRVDLNADDVDDDVSLYDVKNDAKVSLFANLGGSGTDYRKFFYEPDVSFFKHKGKYVLLVAVGSGYRSHPLNTNIEDRFYVLYDTNVLNIPETTPAAITESDLASSTVLAGNNFLPTYKGWYKPLTAGNSEKALASPIIFANKVIFTTFVTTDTAALAGGEGSCSALTNNQTRAYVLNLMTASATADLDGDGVISAADESRPTTHGDIQDTPQLVFNAPSNCSKAGCNQNVDIRIGKSLAPLVDKDTFNGNVDLGDFLPKVYWLND